jgi:hypothetical protein
MTSMATRCIRSCNSRLAIASDEVHCRPIGVGSVSSSRLPARPAFQRNGQTVAAWFGCGVERHFSKPLPHIQSADGWSR